MWWWFNGHQVKAFKALPWNPFLPQGDESVMNQPMMSVLCCSVSFCSMVSTRAYVRVTVPFSRALFIIFNCSWCNLNTQEGRLIHRDTWTKGQRTRIKPTDPVGLTLMSSCLISTCLKVGWILREVLSLWLRMFWPNTASAEERLL